MRKKDIEKKIINSLEDNSPLNQRVLDKALNEMENSKPIKQPVRVWKYAVAFCALIAICLAIALPIALTPKSQTQYIETSYSSMKEYLQNANIDINTLDELIIDNSTPNGSGNNPSSGDSYPLYQQRECKLIKYGKQDICINETYTYGKKDEIKCYLLFDESDKTAEYLFGEWKEFDSNTTILGSEISYYYDAEAKNGICRFKYDGRTFYMSIDAQNKFMFLFHIQIFIDLQKK